MKYTIKSDKLTAVIDSFGAELCSVKDASGREYIWTAEDVWKRHAPLLFPFVCDTASKKYTVGGKEYAGFDEDFVTVNPYLGTDGVKPFVDVCKQYNKGIFVLVKTSNPSSGEFQDQLINGRPLYELVAEQVVEWGEACMGDTYSIVGCVVGATYPEMGKILRKLVPKTYILVPGYGAQGGKAADLVHYFNPDGLGAIVNSSRGIIAAYKQDKYASFGETGYAEASRQAVKDMIADINGARANR